MADTNSALEQLADISEPELILNFALAPIWWLLIVLLLLGLLVLAIHLYQRWQYFTAKRQALQLLEQIAGNGGPATEVNQLLKRVLQHYQPKHPALSFNVEQWQLWLCAGHNLMLPDLNQLLYQAGDHQQARVQFYQFAKTWLVNYQAKAPTLLPKTEINHV